jgi:hypothetical protein
VAHAGDLLENLAQNALGLAAAVNVRVIKQGVTRLIRGDECPPPGRPACVGYLGWIPGPRHPPTTIGQPTAVKQTNPYRNGLHSVSTFGEAKTGVHSRQQQSHSKTTKRELLNSTAESRAAKSEIRNSKSETNSKSKWFNVRNSQGQNGQGGRSAWMLGQSSQERWCWYLATIM